MFSKGTIIILVVAILITLVLTRAYRNPKVQKLKELFGEPSYKTDYAAMWFHQDLHKRGHCLDGVYYNWADKDSYILLFTFPTPNGAKLPENTEYLSDTRLLLSRNSTLEEAVQQLVIATRQIQGDDNDVPTTDVKDNLGELCEFIDDIVEKETYEAGVTPETEPVDTSVSSQTEGKGIRKRENYIWIPYRRRLYVWRRLPWAYSKYLRRTWGWPRFTLRNTGYPVWYFPGYGYSYY